MVSYLCKFDEFLHQLKHYFLVDNAEDVFQRNLDEKLELSNQQYRENEALKIMTRFLNARSALKYLHLLSGII